MMSALKAAPGAMQMASAARSLAPAAKKQAPAAMALARKGISEALPAAASKITKANPAMSGAMSALAKATPHLSALTQKQGLGSTLLSGFKAVRELRGVTRELSKMAAPAASATGKSASGKVGAAASSKNAIGKNGDAAGKGGAKLMIGRVQKNWEDATPANGFRELGGSKGDAARAKGVKIMIGRPQKNWEDATKKNGFRELGGGKSGKEGARAHGVKIMIGRPQKNWEQATAANGFRELGSRKSEGAANSPGKPASKSGKASPGFRLIVGRAKGKGKDAEDAQGGMHIQISFARNGAPSGMADKRVGSLSISLHGAAASHSRKRANAFDGEPTRRKHSHSFASLDSRAGNKARHRSTPTSFIREAPGFSLTIGFSAHGLSPPARQQSGTRHGGRQRAQTI